MDGPLVVANRPQAFSFNDEMATGVLKVARRLDIRVSEQLSVVGFDSIRFAEHIYPALPHKLVVRESTAPPPKRR